MRHILLLLVLASSINILISQDFEAKNVKNFPGEFNSHESFHIDDMGNHYIAGRGTGEIDFDFSAQTNMLPATSWKDLYLAKYDDADNLMWLLSFEGSVVSNQIRTMTSDTEGNIYIGGAFTGSLNLTDDGQNEITSFGSTSMFLAKFDSTGALIWQFTVGDTNFSQYPGNIFIADDKLIVQFIFDGTFDVDPGSGTTMLDGDNNAMLVYDLDGAYVASYDHKGGTVVRASMMDEEGNFYLSGLFSGLVSLDYKTNASIFTNGFFDAFVVKYDKDFNMLWYKRVGKSGTSHSFYEMTLDANQDLIIAASLESGVSVDGNAIMDDANYLIQMTKDGTYTNVAEYLPKSSYVRSMGTTSENQVLLSATFFEDVDIDPTDETHELISLEGANMFLGVYNSDLSLVNSDHLNAREFNTFTLNITDNDMVYILTDYEGVGKCVLGSTEIYMTDGDENFVYYQLDIEGCATTTGEYNVASCDDVVVNGVSFTTSGTFEQILTNAEGCDSVLNIIIEIYPSPVYDTSIVACGPLEINGEIIGISGNYNFVLESQFGCDSTVNAAIDVIEINPGVTMNENELVADESDGDSYQWYDCDTDMVIEGANERTFLPDSDGNYRVQIYKGACSFFTDCVTFTLVNTKEEEIRISISPNPSNGLIYLKGDQEISTYKISLFDLTGRAIYAGKKINSNGLLDLSNANKGVYMLRLDDGEKSKVEKIIIL